MNDKTVDELLELCRLQHVQAQMEVYERYHQAMFVTALKIVHNTMDALVIKMKKNYYLKPSNHKTIAVEVPINALKEIALSGSGSVRSEEQIKTSQLEIKMSGSGKIIVGVATEALEVVLSGSGRIELNGTSAKLEAKLSGSGSIKAKELKAEDGDFSVSGSGRIEANISDELEARVSGSGSVRYQGTPTTRVYSKVNGSGSVKEIKSY